MAKVDWNLFEFGAASSFTQDTSDADINPTQVSPGGSQKSLEITIPPGWTGASPNPVFGYIYNGPDKPEFPLGDGQMSFAIRSGGGQFEVAGLIIRSQVDLSGPIGSPNDLNYYMFGLTQDETVSSNNGSFRLFRVVNGVVTAIGGGPFLISVVDLSTDFCQVEIRAINVGPNIEFYWRRNNGSQLTTPGSPGWTGFGLLAVDSTPGVLINPGHWGFGIASRNFGSISGTHVFNFDRIQITQEIIG